MLSLVCFAAASAGLLPAYSPYAAGYAAPYGAAYGGYGYGGYGGYAAPAVVAHAPVVKAGLKRQNPIIFRTNI